MKLIAAIIKTIFIQIEEAIRIRTGKRGSDAS